jgi:hypothetical protein
VKAWIVIGGLTLVLSGCKMFVDEDPPPCPRVSILADAAKLTRFKPGASTDAKDVTLVAQLTNFKGSCYYDASKQQMSLNFEVQMSAHRGPATTASSAELSYFVAIPTYFPESQAKKIMPVKVDLPEDGSSANLTDESVQISFPLSNVKDLAKYEVFLGWQLDPAELAYNRRPSR